MTRVSPAFPTAATPTSCATATPVLRFRFDDGVRPSSVWQETQAGLKICCWICVENVTVFAGGVGDDGLLLLEQPAATSMSESINTPDLILTPICIEDTPPSWPTGDADVGVDVTNCQVARM